MLNKTTLLTILLGSTFISSPALAASAQNTIERLNAKLSSAYTLKEVDSSDYSFTTVEDGVVKYYKINLNTANTSSSEQISWSTDFAGATDDVKVNFPSEDNPTTLYYTVDEGGYKEVRTNRLTSLISDIGNADEKHLFSGLKLESTSSDTKGGAIYNESINNANIYADFIGNYASSLHSSPNSHGGAIYNNNNGKISNITGDFIGNYAKATPSSEAGYSSSNGGAIYNSGTIGNISGNFIDNYVSSSNHASSGGAIYNNGTIDNINGHFIGNYAAGASVFFGAAINNDLGGTIVNITGDFIGNYVSSSSSYYYSSGGAIYNGFNGTIGNITGDFIGNYVSSSSAFSYGGAIYNYGGTIKNIVNSSFINNYAKSETGTAQGGAIWSNKDILIKADNGKSLFSGNYAEKAGVKTSNAIYMDALTYWQDGEKITKTSTLSLLAKNNGTITFDDGIDGNAYSIVVNGDGSGSVKFNNTVDNVKTFTMNDGSVVHLGLNGVINTETFTTSSSTSISANAANNPIIKVDIKVDKANNKVNSGLINVSGDVSGVYNVIVNALNPEVFENASVAFLKAPNDNVNTASSFNIARVIGSPYMWNNDVKTDAGLTWYLNLSNTVNPDYDPTTPDNPNKPVVRAVTPEVIAGIGLHEAAIEQMRSVVRNVSGKVASGREYCPGCGIYPTSWDSKALRNVWVMAQGESANIDKPADMDAKIWGVEGGFDLQNDVNNTLGVFASYRKGEYDLSGKGSKYYSKLGSEIDIDSYLAGLYYRYDKNMNWLFATVYGGVQQADVKTDDGMSKFDSDGVELGAGLEAGHSFALSKSLTLDPSLGVYYTQISFDNAHDNVGKSYKWDDIKHVEAEAAVKLSQQFENAKVYVKPSLIQTYTDGDSVKISGLNKADTYHDQTLGRIEIGGNYGFTDSLNGYVWSNYTYGSSYDSTAAGLGINYAW